MDARKLSSVRKFTGLGLPFIPVLVLLVWMAASAGRAAAAPTITVVPLTWDVVALRSNLTGPTPFQVGGRICSQVEVASNVVVTLTLPTTGTLTDAFFGIQGPATQTFASVAPGACQDVYFTIAVTPDPSVIGAARNYTLDVQATGMPAPYSRPGRLTVRQFTQDDSLVPGTISGPTNVYTGQTDLKYTVSGAAVPNYGQVMNTLDFPGDRFRVKKVEASYGNPPGTNTLQPYYDACGWDSTTSACTNSGTVGGAVSLVYTVDVIATSGGSVSLSHALYGYDPARSLYGLKMGAPLGITISTAPPTATPTNTYTPGPSNTPTFTNTPGPSNTPTFTNTPGPSSTPTQTPATPASVTPTATDTRTPTFTVTGTPPTATPTRTPTPIPGPTISMSAAPNSLRISDAITFTVTLGNTGSGPHTNVRVEVEFPGSIDLRQVETSKGDYLKSMIRKNIGYVEVGEVAKSESVTIYMRGEVDDGAKLRSYPVVAQMSGDYLGVFQTRTYTTTFTVSGTTSSTGGTSGSGLPNSGYPPVAPANQKAGSIFWPGIIMGLVLGTLGAFTLGYALWTRKHRPEWSAWFARTSLLLLLAGLAFGFLSWGLHRDDQGVTPLARLIDPSRSNLSQESTPIPDFRATGEPWVIDPTWNAQMDPAGMEPGTPLPTPTLPEPPIDATGAPDTSAITRIQAPRIKVDAPVMFLPQQGTEWVDIRVISKEVGWLGGSSRPGMGSNTALTGHVTLADGKAGPFYNLEDLAVGDIIYIFTSQNRYTYTVRETKVVSQADTSVLNPTANSQLTLITCTDWDGNLKTFINRQIVFGDLKEVTPLNQVAASQ